METAVAILDGLTSVFVIELCTKQELLKIRVLIISFILGTVDMVTDWINYIQWSSVGGYDQHYFVFILTTTFLCASLVGTVLWIFEVFLTIKRSRESIQRYQKRPKVLKLDNEHSARDSERSSTSDRLGLTVRILTELLEDLPVVIALYYAPAIIPFCRTGWD